MSINTDSMGSAVVRPVPSLKGNRLFASDKPGARLLEEMVMNRRDSRELSGIDKPTAAATTDRCGRAPVAGFSIEDNDREHLVDMDEGPAAASQEGSSTATTPGQAAHKQPSRYSSSPINRHAFLSPTHDGSASGHIVGVSAATLNLVALEPVGPNKTQRQKAPASSTMSSSCVPNLDIREQSQQEHGPSDTGSLALNSAHTGSFSLADQACSMMTAPTSPPDMRLPPLQHTRRMDAPDADAPSTKRRKTENSASEYKEHDYLKVDEVNVPNMEYTFRKTGPHASSAGVASVQIGSASTVNGSHGPRVLLAQTGIPDDNMLPAMPGDTSHAPVTHGQAHTVGSQQPSHLSDFYEFPSSDSFVSSQASDYSVDPLYLQHTPEGATGVYPSSSPPVSTTGSLSHVPDDGEIVMFDGDSDTDATYGSSEVSSNHSEASDNEIESGVDWDGETPETLYSTYDDYVEAIDRARLAIEEKCQGKYTHSGRAWFVYNPIPGAVGNLVPVLPRLHAEVDITWRLDDNGNFRVFCESEMDVAFPDEGRMREVYATHGMLLGSRYTHRSLIALCSTKNHYIRGRIVSADQNMVNIFRVEWTAAGSSFASWEVLVKYGRASKRQTAHVYNCRYNHGCQNVVAVSWWYSRVYRYSWAGSLYDLVGTYWSTVWPWHTI
ncbi:hypothetical protein BJ508DRAFT_308165 [Ascobolus immersus RN42]|uniref:Uncharacterized protein n=1 Tax=Ascobolus immersus RN42 TaxID=1160509 RepID=A0A3N4I2R2_ASCIM|nr:hypothetical protein BJ508DRAFT_308165 [Ascobolus immersus RN42]